MTAAASIEAPADGPVGRERGVTFVVVFSFVTLGIYYLYWVFKSHEEIKDHAGHGIGGVVGLVVALVAGVITPFALASEVGKLYTHTGRNAPVTGWTGLWVIPGLLIIVGPIVWMVKVQRALNRYWAVPTSA